MSIFIKKGDIWTPYKDENVIVDFSTSKTNTLVLDEIKFYDITYPKPIKWIWTFGDGITSEEQHPIHYYTESGLYTITLSVFFDDGDKFIVKDNYINISNKITIDDVIIEGLTHSIS